MIITGRQVAAEEALAIGLVDRVVAEEDVYLTARSIAADAARGPVLAQALAKRAIDDGLDGTLGAGLTLESELFGQVFATADATAGVRSFLTDGPGKATFSGS
jgi:enoyl-CoA hydratase